MKRAAVVAMVIALCASAGAAQEDPASLVELALEARRAGHDTIARELLRRAIVLAPDGRALALLALTEQSLGDWASADAHLRHALAAGGSAWVAARRDVLDRALDEGAPRVARIALGRLPEGARVRVDGAPATPIEGVLSLPPGEHDIVVELSGHTPASLRAAFAPGNSEWAVVLRPVAAVPETGDAGADAELATAAEEPAAAVSTAAIATRENEGLACPANARAEDGPCVRDDISPVYRPFAGGELRLFGAFTTFTDTTTGLFRRDASDALSGPFGAGGFGFELAARPVWMFSFGMRLAGDFMTTESWLDAGRGTNIDDAVSGMLLLGTASAYLRLHSAETMQAHQVDLWAGGGFGVGGVLFRLDTKRGDSRLWSYVVPVDVGLTYYPAPRLGITIFAGVEPWIVQEYCGTDPESGDAYCLAPGELDVELRIRAGAAFTLPF